ncbi:MAG: GNAT family N-acetyltransferase [Methanomassiliicoccaceae archaeon]|nr:GNAT family N-acetyltransferase [Methanomassiliicoccaceae archaeon]
MTELRFPGKGFRLRNADGNDGPFIMNCMKENLLLSVPENEAKHSELWMDDILGITAMAANGELIRSEMFILEPCDRSDRDPGAMKESAGILWMGMSRDQFTCEDTGYLLGVFLEEELRGRGLGRSLMECAEEWCLKNGLFSMTLNVGSPNTDAEEIYRHLGFSERSTVMKKRLPSRE